MKITAITLGPIVDTFTLVEKPAGLWAASYTFSWLCREIIQILLKNGVGDEEEKISEKLFISPAIKFEEGQVRLDPLYTCDGETPDELFIQGVGLLHDRIVILGDYVEEAHKAVNKAIEKLSGLISDALEGTKGNDSPEDVEKWLKGFLRIPIASMDLANNQANPLTEAGMLISAMELEPSFPNKETNNYMLSLFWNIKNEDGKIQKEGYANRKIVQKYREKLTGFSSSDAEWIIARKGKPKELLSIDKIGMWATYSPNDGRGEKYRNYYAVLQSDGDSMGKLLQKLDSVKAQEFSRQALVFAGRSAKLVRDYGGIPIYSGGDDLLAIVPLFGDSVSEGEKQKGVSILGLIEKINAAFYDTFIRDSEYCLKTLPTLSFGVSVQYKKAPLYEALESARDLLYVAKREPNKNALAIEINKHSGQTHRLVVPNISQRDEEYRMSGELKLINNAISEKISDSKSASGNISSDEENIVDEKSKQSEDTDKRLSSLTHIVEENRILFSRAFEEGCLYDTGREKRKKRIDTLIDNLYDNVNQKVFEEDIEAFKDLAKLVGTNRAFANTQKRLDFLISAMRFQQFMFEEVSEDEADDEENGD